MKRGSIMLETVLVMPILLLLFFGIVQFSQIWTARQMTAYAAYCATRAIMVAPPNEQKSAARNAAEVALSWINIAGPHDGEVTIPGWGKVNGSGRSNIRTAVEIGSNGESDEIAAVKVTFKFPLMIPGMAVNKIIASAAKGAELVTNNKRPRFFKDLDKAAGEPVLIDGWPYIELTETCVLPMPYSTSKFPIGAFNGVNIRGGS